MHLLIAQCCTEKTCFIFFYLNSHQYLSPNFNCMLPLIIKLAKSKYFLVNQEITNICITDQCQKQLNSYVVLLLNIMGQTTFKFRYLPVTKPKKNIFQVFFLYIYKVRSPRAFIFILPDWWWIFFVVAIFQKNFSTAMANNTLTLCNSIQINVGCKSFVLWGL